MVEVWARSGNLALWTEDLGDPADPPVLLVMGMCAQGITWPDDFVAQLVSQGRYVVRYDHRDTGQSDTVDYNTSPYTLTELAEDAVAVLDAHELGSAHVVGASMGGMLGQLLALHHPSRVRTLTAIMSSPVGGDRSQLPAPDEQFFAAMQEAATTPPSSHEERIEHGIKTWRVLSGSLPLDENEARSFTERSLARARVPGSELNHQRAISSLGDGDRDLARITAPTLVVHGTEDPLLALPHGEALADRIPGARLLRIEGMGHSLPSPAREQIAEEIREHTS